MNPKINFLTSLFFKLNVLKVNDRPRGQKSTDQGSMLWWQLAAFFYAYFEWKNVFFLLTNAMIRILLEIAIFWELKMPFFAFFFKIRSLITLIKTLHRTYLMKSAIRGPGGHVAVVLIAELEKIQCTNCQEDQGCQIFVDTIYRTTTIYTKIP
jgi:hypothetical protein